MPLLLLWLFPPPPLLLFFTDVVFFFFSFSFQVVQEYERAVIFRLGRLLSGGSRGPGKEGVGKIPGKFSSSLSLLLYPSAGASLISTLNFL